MRCGRDEQVIINSASPSPTRRDRQRASTSGEERVGRRHLEPRRRCIVASTLQLLLPVVGGGALADDPRPRASEATAGGRRLPYVRRARRLAAATRRWLRGVAYLRAAGLPVAVLLGRACRGAGPPCSTFCDRSHAELVVRALATPALRAPPSRSVVSAEQRAGDTTPALLLEVASRRAGSPPSASWLGLERRRAVGERILDLAFSAERGLDALHRACNRRSEQCRTMTQSVTSPSSISARVSPVIAIGLRCVRKRCRQRMHHGESR